MPSLLGAQEMSTPSQSKVLDGVLRSNGANAFLAVPDAAVADAALDASQLSFSLDEGGLKLLIKVKFADGTTIKTASITIA